MPKTLVEQYVEDPNHMRLFQQERAILEATFLLESVMERLGVSRSELAKRLGKSKGWVTQLLDGEANKTIRTVADAFAVLGQEYHSSSRPIQIGRASHPLAEEADADSAASIQPMGSPAELRIFVGEGQYDRQFGSHSNTTQTMAQAQ